MNSVIKISPELRAALQEYLDWVNAGAPQAEPFDRGTGLCYNFGHNTDQNDIVYDLVEELGDLFSSMGMAEDYPFGAAGYSEAQFTKTQHLYAPRINWIKEILGESYGD